MLSAPRSRRLAAELELDLEVLPICIACLSFVSSTLDHDDEPKIRGALVTFTPLLWEEGLAEPARAAVEEAVRRGVRDAAGALADLDAHGPRTPIARAIVRRLASELSYRSRAAWAARWN